MFQPHIANNSYRAGRFLVITFTGRQETEHLGRNTVGLVLGFFSICTYFLFPLLMEDKEEDTKRKSSLHFNTCWKKQMMTKGRHKNNFLSVNWKSSNYRAHSAIANLQISLVCQSDNRKSTVGQRGWNTFKKKVSPLFGPLVAKTPNVRPQVCLANFFIFLKFELEYFKPILLGEKLCDCGFATV